ncbi:MAG: carbon storage regulator [Pseudomonadota bacterium]|jgi:carbon storage regulator
MLVISRRKGQRITIGDDIELIVTELHRSCVKVGIKAPRGYAVLRGEIRDSIEDANREAAASVLDGDSLLDDELNATALVPALKPSASAVFLEARQAGGASPRQKKHAPAPEVIVRRRPVTTPAAAEGLSNEPVEVG